MVPLPATPQETIVASFNLPSIRTHHPGCVLCGNIWCVACTHRPISCVRVFTRGLTSALKFSGAVVNFIGGVKARMAGLFFFFLVFVSARYWQLPVRLPPKSFLSSSNYTGSFSFGPSVVRCAFLTLDAYYLLLGRLNVLHCRLCSSGIRCVSVIECVSVSVFCWIGGSASSKSYCVRCSACAAPFGIAFRGLKRQHVEVC